MQRKNYPLVIHDHHCCGPDSSLTPVPVRIEIYEIDSISYERRVTKCERFRPQVSNPSGDTVTTNVCLDGVNIADLTEEAFNQLKKCHRTKLVTKY